MDRDPFIEKSQLAGLIAALDIGDEYFWNPERLVPFEHWVGHIPFAFWLVKGLRPRCYVELGTHRGNSYCAMCQGIAALGLDSIGYAIDTWEGDIHIQFEPGLLEELRGYHDPRYGAFSTLLPMKFDEARKMFSTGSIDLLHIDGVHTYDAVRHDFENWLPTLSSRAVVLFHDTNVRKSDFGVWRLWEELSLSYPTFTFSHSHGLGVLGVGTEQSGPLRALFDLASNPSAAQRARALFAIRGDGLIERFRLAEVRAELGECTRLDTELRARATAELKAARAEADQRAIQAMAELKAARAEADRRAIQATAELEAARAEADQRAIQATAELKAARAEADQRAITLRAHAAQLQAATGKAQREITLRAQTAAELQAANARVQREIALRVEAEARALGMEPEIARLRVIERSTMWRALHPLRASLGFLPASIRSFGRRLSQLTWWTFTLQLLRRLKGKRGLRPT
jgi:hypothetical protein